MDRGFKYFILGIVFTLFIFIVGFGGYFLVKSIKTIDPVAEIPQPTLSVQNQNPGLYPDAVATPKIAEPKIYIQDAGGAISETEKNQIVQKIIGPYVDYYKNADQGNIATFTVSLNTNPNNVTYPYLVDVVFDNGTKNSFVIEKKDNSLSWWYPECLGACLLTDEFRTKYPEIVKILE